MFALPLNDDNPTRRPALVTFALIGACVVVFLYQASLTARDAHALLYGLGLIPEALFDGKGLSQSTGMVPSWATLFTSQFLHGGWLHLGANMICLWVFGNNVEDAMGHVRFLVFYLVCGAAAGLAHSLSASGSLGALVPMIGASGAIGGVLGGYLMLYPRANVRVLVWLVVFIRIFTVPAWLVAGFWIMFEFINGTMRSATDSGVAHWAHIGGFLTGLVLITLFKDRSIPLFASARSAAFRSVPAGTITQRGDPASGSGTTAGRPGRAAAQLGGANVPRRGSVPQSRTNRRGLPWEEDRGLPWDDRR